MASDVRKAKGATLDQVAGFFRTQNKDFIQDFSSTADKEIREQIYILGSVFFATSENAIVTPDTIKWAAYVQTGQHGGGVLQTAVVRHLACKQTTSLAREKVPTTTEEFQDFLTALERHAIERGCTAISVKISVRSPWIDLFSQIDDYHIVSNDLPSQGELRVTFEKKLLLGFRGDASEWPNLVSWYLDFCFGSISPDLRSKLERFRQDTGKPLDFSLSGHAARGLPDKALIPGELHLRLVCVPEYSGRIDETVRIDSEKRSRFTILATEEHRGPASSLDKAVSKKDLITLLREVRESIANAGKLKTDMSRPAQAALDTWHELKQMPDRSERRGLVVEIDRKSFVSLLERLKSGSIREYFYFFNDGHFARKVGSDLKVFFFVWDAPIGRLGGGADNRPRGCLCASGQLVEALPLRDDEIFFTRDMEKRWRDPPAGFGAFKDHAVFRDVEFIPKFFSGDVVLLKMSSLSACCPADFADAETGYSGLDHNELLRAAFPQSARWTEQQEKNIKRLLPEWDIGNSYLDDRQTRQLSDELKQCLRGSTVYDWPEKLYPPAPPKPSPPIAASGKMTASYWVSKLRDQPGWSTEFASQNRSMDLKPHDVFLSFATQDAEVVQGRQQLVQKIERWVNIRLERAGLGPIWNYLNQGQGARIGDNWVEPTVWHMATCKCCIIVASREYDAAEVTMKLELPFLLSRKLLEKDKFQLFVARATDHDIKNIQVSTFDGDDSFYPFGDLVDDRQYRQGIDPYPFNNYSLGELLEQGQSNIFEARIVALGDAIATWLSRRQN